MLPQRLRALLPLARRRRRPSLASRTLLRLEALEERTVPAKFDTVMSLADDGSAGTLRQVIQTAGKGDTIVFDSSLAGTIRLDPSRGALTITQNVTITGPGANVLAIDGGHQTGLFYASAFAVSLSGLTLENGSNPSGDGGAIQADDVIVMDISACYFHDNQAGPNGGAIGLDGVAVYGNGLTIDSCTFANNTSEAGSGGAVYFQAAHNGNFNAINSTFVGNSAANGSGGAMYVSFLNTGETTLLSCTITNNSANEGGGVSFDAGSLPAIENSIIAENSAPTDPDLPPPETYTDVNANLIGPQTDKRTGQPIDLGLTPLGDYGGDFADTGGPQRQPCLRYGRSGRHGLPHLRRAQRAARSEQRHRRVLQWHSNQFHHPISSN